MGLRTQSIKTGKKLSIFSKELMFVVAETTFVFEKEEKEEEVLQKKNEKRNKIRSSGFFFLPHSFLHLKPIQPTFWNWIWKEMAKNYHFPIARPRENE